MPQWLGHEWRHRAKCSKTQCCGNCRLKVIMLAFEKAIEILKHIRTLMVSKNQRGRRKKSGKQSNYVRNVTATMDLLAIVPAHLPTLPDSTSPSPSPTLLCQRLAHVESARGPFLLPRTLQVSLARATEVSANTFDNGQRRRPPPRGHNKPRPPTIRTAITPRRRY